jgi:hypothetical protein
MAQARVTRSGVVEWTVDASDLVKCNRVALDHGLA